MVTTNNDVVLSSLCFFIGVFVSCSQGQFITALWIVSAYAWMRAAVEEREARKDSSIFKKYGVEKSRRV
jgi:hypothetical protein